MRWPNRADTSPYGTLMKAAWIPLVCRIALHWQDIFHRN